MPETPETTPADKGPDIEAMIGDLVKKAGDPNAALRTLLAERDTLRDELAGAKAKLPKDGHAVIDPDAAKLFGSYQGLGAPDEIKAALYERDELKSWKAGEERKAFLGEVAALAGFKPTVLEKLAADSGLEIEVTDGKDRLGRPAKVPTVKDDGKAVPLADYAARHWADFLPALQADGTARPAPPSGTPPRWGSNPPRPPVVPDRKHHSLVR